MIRILRRSLAGLLACCIACSASAMERDTQRATQREAYAMFEKAVKLLEKEGAEKAFAAFNDTNGAFVHKDLYVFAIDQKGNYVANGAVRSLVGTNALETRDAAGNPLFRNMLDAVKVEREAKVRYIWLNRKDNRIEPKVTFLHRRGDHVLGVGYYAPRSTAAQAQALADKAAALLKQQGLGKAAMAFHDKKGDYLHNDLYVFVVGLDSGKFEANGTNAALVGSNARALADVNGKLIVEEMISLAKKQGQGSVSYTWTNPVTNALEKKETFIRKVGNSLVGVGYYQE